MIKNKTFSKILEYTNNIENLLLTLQQKQLYLKKIYDEILLENTTIDVVATDSFAFQNNIFELKIKNNKSMYYKISNQIYADYYKLIKYITNYTNNYIKNSEQMYLDDTIINCVKLIENIEPYKINTNNEVYNIKNSQHIYNYIIDIIEILEKIYKKVNDSTKTKEMTLNKGINIDNYIYNINYNNNNLKNNIDLFNTFLNSYCNYHLKFLLSLQNDLNNFYNTTIYEIDFTNVNLDNTIYSVNNDICNNDICNNDICYNDVSNNYIIKKNISVNNFNQYSPVMRKYFMLVIKINTYICVTIFSYFVLVYFKI
tara:strand:+ start:5422 stop:6360 length:939 start_codon:yes stop_codon:yes gene_type:complete